MNKFTAKGKFKRIHFANYQFAGEEIERLHFIVENTENSFMVFETQNKELLERARQFSIDNMGKHPEVEVEFIVIGSHAKTRGRYYTNVTMLDFKIAE